MPTYAQAVRSTPDLTDPFESSKSSYRIPNSQSDRTQTSKANQEVQWQTITKPVKTIKAKTKETRKDKTRRLVLIKASLNTYSAMGLRNAINKAFSEHGIKGPVVFAITKSLVQQNLVITTSPAYSASFLLEKRAIWDSIINYQSIQIDEPWFKVIIHGIPISEFSYNTAMTDLVSEIKEFNEGFEIIGTPYWLTHQDKRISQIAGSVVIAFKTETEALRAIRHRLYIGAISVRVSKFLTTSKTTQCSNCQGFGHLDSYCKKPANCKICAEKHVTRLHTCDQCHIKGKICDHTIPKCVNCKGDHEANIRSCPIIVALKKTIYDL